MRSGGNGDRDVSAGTEHRPGLAQDRDVVVGVLDDVEQPHQIEVVEKRQRHRVDAEERPARPGPGPDERLAVHVEAGHLDAGLFERRQHETRAAAHVEQPLPLERPGDPP